MPNNSTPVVSPLLALLRSRKFLLALLGVLFDLLIVFLPPETAPRILAMREELLGAATLIIGVLIGGIALEDAAEKHAPVLLSGDTIKPPNGELVRPVSTPEGMADKRATTEQALPPLGAFGPYSAPDSTPGDRLSRPHR